MTKLVIQRVEQMARNQGYRTLKFFNRKRQEMLFDPIDTLEGVGGRLPAKNELIDEADENYIPPLAPNENGSD